MLYNLLHHFYCLIFNLCYTTCSTISTSSYSTYAIQLTPPFLLSHIQFTLYNSTIFTTHIQLMLSNLSNILSLTYTSTNNLTTKKAVFLILFKKYSLSINMIKGAKVSSMHACMQFDAFP